jgi:hypothetical protein
MLRTFAAFLLMFSVLGLVVGVDDLACLLGVASLGLFAIDLLLSDFAPSPHSPRTRGEPLV